MSHCDAAVCLSESGIFLPRFQLTYLEYSSCFCLFFGFRTMSVAHPNDIVLLSCESTRLSGLLGRISNPLFLKLCGEILNIVNIQRCWFSRLVSRKRCFPFFLKANQALRGVSECFPIRSRLPVIFVVCGLAIPHGRLKSKLYFFPFFLTPVPSLSPSKRALFSALRNRK